jgi:hypothetical protein
MAIPGNVTNQTLYTNPGPDNSFGGNFLQVANAMLKNYQAQQAQKEEAYGKVFPSLVAMKGLAPTTKGTPGSFQYPNNSGMNWLPQTPPASPEDTYKKLQIQDLNTELGNKAPTDVKRWNDALALVYKNYQGNLGAQMNAQLEAKKRYKGDVNAYLKDIAMGIYNANAAVPGTETTSAAVPGTETTSAITPEIPTKKVNVFSVKPKRAIKAPTGLSLEGTKKGKKVYLAQDGNYYYPEAF